jgi:transcriptional regulator with XRE-family HTH domain
VLVEDATRECHERNVLMLDIGIMAGYTVAMLLFFVYAGGAMAFRDKLVTLRKARGISQEVLADYIGIARQSVAKWEAGESLPDLEKLLAISQYFLVSLDALVRDDPYVYPHAPPALIPDPALLQFLCTAKRATYAGAGTEVTSSRLQSHDLYYAAGPLEYYDTYLGGTPLCGDGSALAAWHANLGHELCGAGAGCALFGRFSERSAPAGVRSGTLPGATALPAWCLELPVSGGGRI